ncbi:MAG: metallophosphoesterase family protein, partial [Chitinophagaceae bacterium]
MKILHTADWHLGKRLDIYSRMKEQQEVMEEICSIASNEKVDVVLIAGDLFDTYNPSAEAEDLLYNILVKLSDHGNRAVIAIAGNHDAPDRIDAPNTMAMANGIFLAGYPDHKMREFTNDKGIQILRSDEGFIELKIPSASHPLRLIMTPYANELRMKTYLGDGVGAINEMLAQKWRSLAEKYCDDKGVNILMAHLFFMKKGSTLEKEDDGERSILHVGGAQPIFSENIPKQMQYVALGHLHRFHAIDNDTCPIVYSSSPLCYSFAEAGQIKKV